MNPLSLFFLLIAFMIGISLFFLRRSTFVGAGLIGLTLLILMLVGTMEPPMKTAVSVSGVAYQTQMNLASRLLKGEVVGSSELPTNLMTFRCLTLTLGAKMGMPPSVVQARLATNGIVANR